jgi:hypothetical protein
LSVTSQPTNNLRSRAAWLLLYFFTFCYDHAAVSPDLQTTFGSVYRLDEKNVKIFPIKKLPAVRQGVNLILY